MFGPPKDVEGECNARLYIGDDYGDNCATMRCQLTPGHNGPHQEKFAQRAVTVTWEVDEREEDDVETWEDVLDEEGFRESGGVVFVGQEDDKD